METQQQGGDQGEPAYQARYEERPAFDLVGFTQIVESGGELYGAARSDGRWDVLRGIAGDDKTIYGVASLDKECPKGKYRYTLGVRQPADLAAHPDLARDLYSMHIKASGWMTLRRSTEHSGTMTRTSWSPGWDGPLTQRWACTSTPFRPPLPPTTTRSSS